MTELVLDASVVLKWFRSAGGRHLEQARSVRRAFALGELVVFVPPLLRLEIVNVAGRRWHRTESALITLATALDELGFELVEPQLTRVARWTARGLSAYDAAYVAVAEANDVPLLTDEDRILAAAPGVATALGDARG